MDTLLLVLRVTLSLALVLGIMWFVARRVGKHPTQARGVAVDVVGRRSLGRRSGVAVVEVEGRRLVLGVSDAGVRLVADLGEVPTAPMPEPAAVVPTTRRPRPAARDFATVLAAQDPTTHVPAAQLAVALGAAAQGPAAPPTRRANRPAHAATLTPPSAAALARTTGVARQGGPLAGSVLDKATWSRARAALTGRVAAP